MVTPISQLTLSERLFLVGGLWPLLVPGFSVIVLMLVLLMPTLPQAPWLPSLGLGAVLFWTIHQPRGMPPALVFLLGCLQDLWTGMPLGPSALGWLLIAVVVRTQLLVFQSRPFRFEWMVLLPTIGLALALLWILADMATPQSLSAGDLPVRWLSTWLCYPAEANLCGRIWAWALERRFR